jgi:cyclophilin family peptidyl-prolyl cis-trans isomerase/HEAT repeat protein
MAQDNAMVEAVAPLIAAEDAREWAPATLRAGIQDPEPLVRRVAAMAIGRIGHPHGVELLAPALTDPDSTVQTAASIAAAEAVTALAKIGGGEAREFIAGLLRGTAVLTTEEEPAVRQAALEAWRLRDLAPSDDLIAFYSEDDDLRWRVVYSLSRLRPAGASQRFIDALRDVYAPIRSLGARALSASYSRTAGLDSSAIIELLRKSADDDNAGVRIQAIRALGSYRRDALSPMLLVFVDDPHPGVRVQALMALAQCGGPAAAAEFARVLEEGNRFALERQALRGLAMTDSAGFVAAASAWTRSGDWRQRAESARAWARISPGPVAGKPDFLRDSDGRVVGAALEAWSDEEEEPGPALVAEARRLLSHADAVVRTVAAKVLERSGDPGDVPQLTAMFDRARQDSISDAGLAALAALRALSEATPEGRSAVSMGFLASAASPEKSLLRRWAEREWPTLAGRWEPSSPIETGRTLEDYRALARQYVVNQREDAYPHVFLETQEGRTIELELFGPEAPITVANFLSLVDRRFFDGNRWHRVVPDFVVQDGDPRGDGWGGPRETIRDEINARRYQANVVGMALSGPDTGSSQWFITLSPQPHLDGTYTVFGRVVGNAAGVQRIMQGDLIRSIHR